MATKPSNDVGPFGRAAARLLLDARTRLGLSQSEVASTVGVSQSQLSKMERGLRSISLDDFESWCEALHLDMGDVLDEADAADNNVIDLYPTHTPGVAGLDYVADSSPDEPEEGDDDYHDGP